MKAYRSSHILLFTLGFIAALLFIGGIHLSEAQAQTCNDNGVCEPGLGEECEGGINNSANACADCFNQSEDTSGFQCTAGVSCPITATCGTDQAGLPDDSDCVDCNPCTVGICETPNVNGGCTVTQLSCNTTTPDLCCPQGCDSGSDADCPQSSTTPPPPTGPTPTGPPPTGIQIEGAGCALRKSS